MFLEWDAYYASAYSLQVSSDGVVWNTVFSTTSEDGGTDSISLSGLSARYVRLESTAWSDNTLRVWLKEFQILGSGGSTAPTNTSTPPPPTPTATVSPAPELGVHVGDLDGSSILTSKNRWDAEVEITVHDQNESLVANAIVLGYWSGAASETASCTTGSSGSCFVSLTGIRTNAGSVTLTISDISGSSFQYLPADNHDPDGDSDGSSITMP